VEDPESKLSGTIFLERGGGDLEFFVLGKVKKLFP